MSKKGKNKLPELEQEKPVVKAEGEEKKTIKVFAPKDKRNCKFMKGK